MHEIIYMKKSEYDKMHAAELREKYLKETPEGYSKADIKSMADNAILDMDYFLNEWEYDGDDYGDFPEPAVIYRIIDDTPTDYGDDDGIPF